ncbi:MAG: hypothetical protein OXI79_01160 [Gammaproteobacteria bacterium]|nr:hypothetical protein [Gammaproteobacteria bacterium]
MPEIEHGSTPSRTSGYNAPPELPPRPVGGFRRKASTQTTSRHEGQWARPVGEAALRLAGAQQATLRARAVSVAPSSSERFLPGLRSGEGTYQSLLETTTPEHVYEQINVRTHTPPADPHRDPAASESAAEEPHYEFDTQDPTVEEPHYEFDTQDPTVEEPHYEFDPNYSPVEEHDYELPPSESPLEDSYGASALGEVDGEEPHYEVARDPAAEHIYDNPRDSIYETPAPSGLGSLNGLGVYLVNGLEGGKIPNELKGDLQTALVYARQLDQDVGRVATLLGKLDAPGGTLTEAERQEVNSLIGSNKHNLTVVQSWLVGREEELHENGNLTPETRAFFQALQTRTADRHMDLADLTCMYDLDEASPDDPVSREDRCNAHLLDAEAAVAVARGLQGVDPAVKDRLVADLEQHRDLLINVKDAAGDRLEIPGDGRLALAGKELWDTPVPLQKSGAGSGRDIAALRAQWRNTGPGEMATLPVAHPKVGQARMLQEFIRFRLGEANATAPDLKRVFQSAKNQVINNQPWEAVTNRIRTSMPDDPGRSVAVDSRIVPGKAFAAHFPEDYPSNGINCSDRTQYKHVPNLAQTTLTNSSGEVLFSGFRHGVLDAYDIDGDYLASLPDASLRTMIGDLLGAQETDAGSREAYVEAQLAQIRSDPKAAQQAAETMRGQASRQMASEMAVAALAADPQKLQDALNGDTVDVALSSISVLTPDSLRNLAGSARSDERTMLNHQTEAFRQLAAGNPVELRVRDNGGALHTVKVNVRLRQFNFGVNAGAVGRARVGPVSIPSQTPGWRNLMGWGFAMERNNPQLQRLFGEANVSELGGDVGDRLFLMRRQAEQIAAEVDDIEDYIELREGEDTSDLDEEAATQRAELASLNKRIESLDSAARQAKAIWASNDYRAGGGDPFKMVSRLALVGHMMGETPLFNCKSGKDRTGQLDAEVKFLATAADQNGGTVPAPDESMEAWRGVRSDFVFNTGNLEMQRLNTGLPGYKLKGVPGLANVIRDGMKPLYRGGSAYVAA